jgi:hypothetical protein
VREIIAPRTCAAVINAVIIFGDTSNPHAPTPSVVLSLVMTTHLFAMYMYVCVCVRLLLIPFKIDAPKSRYF